MYLDELYKAIQPHYPELCNETNPSLTIGEMLSLSEQLSGYSNSDLLTKHPSVVQGIYDLSRSIKTQGEATLRSNHTSFKLIYTRLMLLIPALIDAVREELKNPTTLANREGELNKLAKTTIAYLTEMQNGAIPFEFDGWTKSLNRFFARQLIGLDFEALIALAEKHLPPINLAYKNFQLRQPDSGLNTPSSIDSSQPPTPPPAIEAAAAMPVTKTAPNSARLVAQIRKEISIADLPNDREGLLEYIRVLTKTIVITWNKTGVKKPETLITAALKILYIQQTPAIDLSFPIENEAQLTASEGLSCHAHFLSLIIIAHFQGNDKFQVTVSASETTSHSTHELTFEPDDICASVSEICSKYKSTLFQQPPPQPPRSWDRIYDRLA